MISLRHLANIAALGSALTAAVAIMSIVVCGCPCQQGQQSLQVYDVTKVNSTQLNSSPKSTSSIVGWSNVSAQVNPIGGVAIAVAFVLVAGGSTASLVYKALANRKSVTPSQPHLNHPELELTDRHQEALPQSGELFDLKRAVALTR